MKLYSRQKLPSPEETFEVVCRNSIKACSKGSTPLTLARQVSMQGQLWEKNNGHDFIEFLESILVIWTDWSIAVKFLLESKLYLDSLLHSAICKGRLTKRMKTRSLKMSVQ